MRASLYCKKAMRFVASLSDCSGAGRGKALVATTACEWSGCTFLHMCVISSCLLFVDRRTVDVCTVITIPPFIYSFPLLVRYMSKSCTAFTSPRSPSIPRSHPHLASPHSDTKTSISHPPPQIPNSVQRLVHVPPPDSSPSVASSKRSQSDGQSDDSGRDGESGVEVPGHVSVAFLEREKDLRVSVVKIS